MQFVKVLQHKVNESVEEEKFLNIHNYINLYFT